MVEKCTRREMCYPAHQYAKANNKYKNVYEKKTRHISNIEM